MLIPSIIKVGPIDVVCEVMDMRGMRIANKLAQYDPIYQVITINTVTTKQSLAVDFMHELIHAIIHNSAMGCYTEFKNEDIATSISVGLAMVWRDNPHLVKWWSSLLK